MADTIRNIVIPLFMILFILFYLWLVNREINRFIKGIQATSWPTTTGKIFNSKLIERWGSEDMEYEASISYSYTALGKEYESNNLYFGLLSPTSKWPAKYLVKKYKRPESIKIYYNPNSPNESVLIVGLNVIQLHTLIILLIYGIFAVYFSAALYGLIFEKI